MYKIQDLHISDLDLKKQILNNLLSGNVQEAQNIYNNNEQLKGKCSNEDNLNMFVDKVNNLEDVYDINVTQTLESNLNRFDFNIDNFINLDEFKMDKQYEINNFVFYKNDVYYCYKKPPKGIIEDSQYWLKLGLQGSKGNSTLGINYVGRWHPKREYSKFDMISTSHELYVAKEANINTNPLDNPNIWEKSLVLESPKINIVKIQADFDNLKVGDIYYKV